MESKKCVCLCATIDTKAPQACLLQEELTRRNIRCLLVDISLQRAEGSNAQIGPAQILGDAYPAMLQAASRSEAAALMTHGLSALFRELTGSGTIDGIVGIGGGGGASVICKAMTGLPFGFPKLMVTPSASGDTTWLTMGEDILLINPVVDLQAKNGMLRHIFAKTAAILQAQLATAPLAKPEEKAAAVTAFGVTTPCVNRCVSRLEEEGFTVYTFTARGISGGRILERMIQEGRFCAVLDITTSEIIDEVAGGIYSAGEQRLRSAAAAGIPYVVVPGALEMINSTSGQSAGFQAQGRTIYAHTPQMHKIRANAEELTRAGEIFAQRLSHPNGNACLCIPCRGFSSVNQKGKSFYDPEADAAFIRTVQQRMDGQVPAYLAELHINDPAFADLLIQHLLNLCAKQKCSAKEMRNRT